MDSFGPPMPAPGAVKAELGEPMRAEATESAVKDPVRIQAAAVAAQQAALTEEEARLVQRRAALEKQEEQLAAHLEERRLKLLNMSERAQAHRAAFEKDRLAGEQRLQQATRELEELGGCLQAREQALADKRVRFHTQYELSRCHLREAWQRLRQDQFRWKHRRGKERAALKVRERDSEAAEQQLLQAQRLSIKEKRAWDSNKTVLQTEVDGLEARVRNQRDKISEQQKEIARLDAKIAARLQERAEVPQPSDHESATATAWLPTLAVATAPTQEAWHKRFHDLERLAGDLADQRMQLFEGWQRLGLVKASWEDERQRASRELDELARRLVDNSHRLSQRQQAGLQADQVLRQRHQELVEMRQQMIAWRARLRLREKSWEGERNRLLTDVQSREELANRHLNVLVNLRQHWAECRRQELVSLSAERQALENMRKQHGQQCLLLADQTTALATEKRRLAEKSLALEQYRQEFLAKAASPSTERRLERLRRRWLVLNATAIRAAARERESLKALLLSLEGRYAELQIRADAMAQAEAVLSERHTAWEHKQALAAARQARLQHELQSAQAQRRLSEQQVARMKEEIERIAGALIDEPDPPISEALDQAA